MATDPSSNPPPTSDESVFAAALECTTPALRQAYLDQACAGMPATRQRVEELLQAHDHAGEFLNQPAAGSAGGSGNHGLPPTVTLPPGFPDAQPPDELPGSRIGRYRLIRRLGEGGCGTVYLAEQDEPVRLRVALKVIKPGMDTRSVISRFEAERNALARMDHAGIARVLDAGMTDSGRPYFVMELVQGIPITRFCDENRLNTHERLELFIRVCHAVQHAHQKGIIHRDIKPSNILVALHDGQAVPKVIDFGIAKATEGRLGDASVHTQLNQFLGTPAYMSPEQADMNGMDIDTRSDIYSLGVLLYELLTGTTPFDTKELVSSGIEKMRRTLREEEPQRPSTRLMQGLQAPAAPGADSPPPRPSASSLRQRQDLVRQLQGDLDWVVMKCLEKDRQRRYETASGLAADLTRHLGHEPVVARPPSSVYRLQKAIHRNRLLFVATAAGLLLLVIGSSLILWQAIRAGRAEKEALEQARIANREREDSEAIVAFFAGVFTNPDRARNGRSITIAETLDRAVKRLDTDLVHQPDQQARLLDSVAETYRSLGLYRESVPLLERVLAHSIAHSGPDSPVTLRSKSRLAESYLYASRPQDALKLLQEVLARQKPILGLQHSETLLLMDRIATSFHETGNWAEAFRIRKEVVELHQRVHGPEHRRTLAARRMLAFSHSAANEHPEALRQREELLPFVRRVLGPEDRETLWSMSGLADSYTDNGLTNQAAILRRETLDLSLKILGQEHPDTLHAMKRLADSHERAGRREEAIRLLQEVIALGNRHLGPDHKYLLEATARLASLYAADPKRLPEALRLLEQVLATRTRVSGLENPDTLLVMHLLAAYYHDARLPEPALRHGELAANLLRKVVGMKNPTTLWSVANLAEYHLRLGHHERALTLRAEVLEHRRKLLGDSHIDTRLAMDRLASSYEQAGRFAEVCQLREEIARAEGSP